MSWNFPDPERALLAIYPMSVQLHEQSMYSSPEQMILLAVCIKGKKGLERKLFLHSGMYKFKTILFPKYFKWRNTCGHEDTALYYHMSYFFLIVLKWCSLGCDHPFGCWNVPKWPSSLTKCIRDSGWKDPGSNPAFSWLDGLFIRIILSQEGKLHPGTLCRGGGF